jgi:hypothetical protein
MAERLPVQQVLVQTQQTQQWQQQQQVRRTAQVPSSLHWSAC